MKVLVFMSAFLLPLISHANLWCALGSKATPSELLDRGYEPYQEVQVDLLSSDSSEIQVYIVDHYGEGRNSQIIIAKTNPNSIKDKVNNVAMADYSAGISLMLKEGRILLTTPNGKFACEVSGYYQKYYLAD